MTTKPILVPGKEEGSKIDLVAAFTAAKAAAEAADPGEGFDGGTCNFDAPAVRLEGVRESTIKKAAELAGVSADPFNWFGGKRWHCIGINVLKGQGNRRTAMAEAANKALEAAGLRACCYMQAD